MKNKRIFIFALIIVALLSAAVGGGALAQSNSAPMWGVEYFNNLDWISPAASVVWVPSLYFNWNGNPPAGGVGAINWSMRAARTEFFYGATYRFEFLADDDFQFRINDRVWLDTIGQGQSGKSFSIDIPMTQGNNHIEIRYRQYTGNSYFYYRATLVGSNPVPTPTPAPGVCLTPQPSASTVQTQFGDYTPCIQNNLHQSNCFVSDGAWDSPNLGSIQMEPQIVIWGNCQADSWATMVIQQCGEPRSVKCSKTQAGWFPG